MDRFWTAALNDMIWASWILFLNIIINEKWEELGRRINMISFIKTSHLFLSDSFLQATTGFISSLIISLFLLQRAGYHSYCSDFYISLLLFRIYRFLAIFRLFLKCFKQMIRKRNHFFLLINFCSKTMKKY